MDYKNGDIYFNQKFQDLWVYHDGLFGRINDDFSINIELERPIGFVKVGHIDLNIGMEVK